MKLQINEDQTACIYTIKKNNSQEKSMKKMTEWVHAVFDEYTVVN